MDEKAIRENLIKVLEGRFAHISLDSAIEDLTPELYGKRIDGYPHTAWQILEHIRIAQWDMLEFSRNQEHKSPGWPDEYWPENDAPPDQKAWDKSVEMYHRDMEEFIELLKDENIDLTKPFEHGTGQSLFIEALQLMKHNSYHIGQLALMRKALTA